MTVTQSIHDHPPLEVTPIGAMGARISGIDISKPLDEPTRTALREAYLAHHLITLPEQHLEPEQLTAFGRIFGDLESHVLEAYHHPDTPLVMVLSNVKKNDKPIGLADAGTYWHSDVSYKEHPSATTVLYSLEIPSQGGDTLFTNMRAAYEALPEATRTRLAGLRATHHYAQRYNRLAEENKIRAPLNPKELEQTPPVSHPVVRTHPDTGAKSLFVNPGFTVHIEGLPDDESEALLQELFDHCLEDRFRFRYKWRVGDVVVWDNASVMHAATSGELSPDQHRTLWRLVGSGDKPF